MKRYTIGQFSRDTGITAKALRIYEKKGLLIPFRDEQNGYRYYDETAKDTIQIISMLKFLGFSLSQISEFLLDNRSSCHADILRSQKRLLEEKAEQLNSMIFCINRAIIECEQNNYSAKSTLDAMNIVVKGKRYDDDFALMKRFNRTPLEWNRWIYEQSDIAENMSVLDAGSGIGYLWRAAANIIPSGVKITCLDRRNTNADLFYDNISSGRLNINAEFEFVWANMEKYELTRQYDRIFLNHVISFIENPSALLYKFKSALNPNGMFICTWGDDTLRKEIAGLLSEISPLKSTLDAVCDKSAKLLHEREELLNTVFDDVERRVFVTDCTFDSEDECYSFIVRQFSQHEAVFEKCRPQIIDTIQNNMTCGKISLKKNTLLYRCR